MKRNYLKLQDLSKNSIFSRAPASDLSGLRATEDAITFYCQENDQIRCAICEQSKETIPCKYNHLCIPSLGFDSCGNVATPSGLNPCTYNPGKGGSPGTCQPLVECSYQGWPDNLNSSNKEQICAPLDYILKNPEKDPFKIPCDTPGIKNSIGQKVLLPWTETAVAKTCGYNQIAGPVSNYKFQNLIVASLQNEKACEFDVKPVPMAPGTPSPFCNVSDTLNYYAQGGVLPTG